MYRISHRVTDLAQLPSVLEDLRQQLRYHTESGFTAEEANGYAQQVDEVEARLVPLLKERLQGSSYEITLDAVPLLGGFLKIGVSRGGGQPVVVFEESYARFDSGMCDGSCYQFVHQKVLGFEEDLSSGRVGL